MNERMYGILVYEAKREPSIANALLSLGNLSDGDISEVKGLPWIRDTLKWANERKKKEIAFNQVNDQIGESISLVYSDADPMGYLVYLEPGAGVYVGNHMQILIEKTTPAFVLAISNGPNVTGYLHHTACRIQAGKQGEPISRSEYLRIYNEWLTGML